MGRPERHGRANRLAHRSGNWNVIGSCFLTSSWQVKTTAQFGGTCVGVFLIVVLIESVRRWGREWDRFIVRQAMQNSRRSFGRASRRVQTTSDAEGKASHCSSQDGEIQVAQLDNIRQVPLTGPRGAVTISRLESAFFGFGQNEPGAHQSVSRFRPTVLQQAVRSLVYAIQFAGAVSADGEPTTTPADGARPLPSTL